MTLTNLEKVIAEINSPTEVEFDGEKEIMESPYRFVVKIDYENDDRIIIFDEYEYFNIDSDEENRWSHREICREFGFKYTEPESVIEAMKKKFCDALKEDLGYEVYLEWCDSVMMCVCEA